MKTETMLSHQQIYANTKIQIEAWLQAQNARVYRPRIQVSPIEIQADFIVIEPLPFAIIILNPAELPGNELEKLRFLLARRLSLAQRLGAHFPLFAIIPETVAETQEKIPFIDYIISITQLPDIKKLLNLVRLDSAIISFLKKGMPKNKHLTDYKKYNSLWSNVVTIQQLNTSSKFPSNTVAENLRVMVQSQKKLRFDKLIREKIQQIIVEKLGGKFEPLQVSLSPYAEGYITMPVWYTPLGKHFVIEVQQISSSLYDIQPSSVKRNGHEKLIRNEEVEEQEDFYTKAIEKSYQERVTIEPNQKLFIDGWLIRSLSSIHIDDFLVLLGATNVVQIETLIGVKTKKSITLKTINFLEAGQWRVCPWDFTKPEPNFITILQNWCKK